MTATVSTPPIPGNTPCPTSLRISCAPLGSSPTAVLGPSVGTSHVHRLMAEAALLRTISETDSAVPAAWDSEEDHEVRDPVARPQIPAVSAPPTAR